MTVKNSKVIFDTNVWMSFFYRQAFVISQKLHLKWTNNNNYDRTIF